MTLNDQKLDPVAYGIALASPLLGDHAFILMAALAGAMWPLSSRRSRGIVDNTVFLIRLVATASVLTGFVAHLIELKTGLHAQEVMSPVSFLIGAMGDRWRTVFRDVFEYVRSLLPRRPQ